MSRYEWKKNDFSYAIGYDPVKRTFFAQIHDDAMLDDEANDCILYLGAENEEFPQLQPLINKFAESVPDLYITNHLKLHLEADKDGFSGISEYLKLPENIRKCG